ncbi:hypothetical protein F2Q69_00005220 [Brassica cretica]|uniref:Uncharacterized protein n=1 Tax=Brassica cretica TaxID=69181 RepID=A0A8S9NUN0_BRACR|nr:hypothetical protein F2Q69_00005220 [Brassica cretica]
MYENKSSCLSDLAFGKSQPEVVRRSATVASMGMPNSEGPSEARQVDRGPKGVQGSHQKKVESPFLTEIFKKGRAFGLMPKILRNIQE